MKAIKTLHGLILTMLLFLMASATYITSQNALIDAQLSEFTGRRVLDTKEVILNYGTKQKITMYYKLERNQGETDRGLFEGEGTKYFGKKGDILLTNQNPFAYDRNQDGRYDVDPPFVLGSFLSVVWGGHVVLVAEEDGSRIIHAVGSEIALEDAAFSQAVRYDINNWHILGGQIVGLRVKKAEPKDWDNAVAAAETFLGQPFNYSLLFDRKNKKGCTDLVFMSYKEAGFSLDFDLGPVSGNDLILSPLTYVFLYAYTDQSGVRHIYYI